MSSTSPLTSHRIPGLLVAGLGTAVWLYSGTFPQLEDGYPGPGLFPRVIAAGLFISGVLLVIFASPGPGPEQTEKLDKQGLIRAILLLCLIGAIPFVQPFTGILPVLAVLVFGAGWLFRVRLWVCALTAALTTGFVYIIFSQLLSVPL